MGTMETADKTETDKMGGTMVGMDRMDGMVIEMEDRMAGGIVVMAVDGAEVVETMMMIEVPPTKVLPNNRHLTPKTPRGYPHHPFNNNHGHQSSQINLGPNRTLLQLSTYHRSSRIMEACLEEWVACLVKITVRKAE